MNRSALETIRYMNGSGFSKAMYMNRVDFRNTCTGSHNRTTITLKLPPPENFSWYLWGSSVFAHPRPYIGRIRQSYK